MSRPRRGDAGVGRDLDLLLILRHCDLPVRDRLRRWDTSPLPLATDLLVYSRAEWESLPQRNPKLADVPVCDVQWLVGSVRDSQTRAWSSGMERGE